MLEHEAEPVVHPAARLGHQRDASAERRPAGVLDEVRVARRDERAADPVALQPALLDQPPGPRSPGGFLKTLPNVRLFVGWVAFRCASSSATSALIRLG